MTEKTPALLVVDDRPDNLFIIEQLVNEYIPDCIVHTAANADIAVQMTQELQPDGVLSDIQMPGKNGVELCRILKQGPKTNHIPVLLITAHESNPNLRVQGLEAGADDFIARPIDNLELAARIKVMFRIKHMHDELIEAKGNLEKTVAARTENLKKTNDQLILEIEEHRQTEEELQESKKLIETVIENIPLMIFLKEATDLRFVMFNRAGEELLGYAREVLLGKNDLDLFSSEQAANFMTKDREVLDGELEILDIPEEPIMTAGKGLRLLHTRKICIRGQDGVTKYLLGISEDITERKQAEEEKQTLESRLQQAQKMEAIGTLAGGIAHDFNNILAIILGYADMAKEDAPLGTRFEKDLTQVVTAANRAKDLVQQILAFSRQTDVERIPIKIQPLIKEGLKMLRSSIPSTISITEDIDPQSGVILADPTQIHQILMNLCTNAYHAMEEKGGILSVTLKTTFIGPDDKEMLLHVNPGEYVELTVTDTGAGMDPDTLRKIFDPYFTTKKVGKGTGMGLAIIHGITKEYGGAITVESMLGKESTFHVYFPVVDKNVQLEKKGSENIRGNERILFIDDEEIIAEMGKGMLERLGYHVTVRRSSLEALATFQNTPNEFDVIITDQTMPDMTGSDLARRMLQIKPDIPIILCTGYSNLVDEDSAKGLGIKEFALKPLTKGVMSKLIRKVLDEKQEIIP